jgi:hypothetical protein
MLNLRGSSNETPKCECYCAACPWGVASSRISRGKLGPRSAPTSHSRANTGGIAAVVCRPTPVASLIHWMSRSPPMRQAIPSLT